MESVKGELGLNSHHENSLSSYLRFCRSQQGERLRSIEACFDDVISTRLMEETYTKEEVEDLFKNLSEMVENEIETELRHNTHCNSLLLTSLCSQAQKWHLDLNVNIAQLENQEKLEVIKQFDSSEHRPTASPLKMPSKLAPLQGEKTVPTSLLEAHIEKLTTDNAELLNQIKGLQEKLLALTLERENIRLDHSAKEKEIDHLKSSLVSSRKEEDVIELNDKLLGVKLQLNETEEKSKEEKDELMQNLSTTEESLRQMQSQLALAEKELEKRFSQTSAYQNMKKMLVKKNSHLRQLRRKLQNYEPSEEDFMMEED